MRTVDLSGLIGKEICIKDSKGNTSAFGYECVGYGVDADTEEPTVFLFNESNGNVFERVLSLVSVKKRREKTND